MINKELTKGSTGMLVLCVLSEQDMYGYQIIKELEVRSENVFSMKEGTLYPLLHLLENKGFLNSYWQQQDNGRKRKYYAITENGRTELNRQKAEWKEFSGAVAKVVEYSF